MDEENPIVTSFPDLFEFYKDFDRLSIHFGFGSMEKLLIKMRLKKFNIWWEFDFMGNS